MDKIRQPTRAEIDDDINIEQPEAEPSNIPEGFKEFLEITDSKGGLAIRMGSCSLNAEGIADLLLRIRIAWNIDGSKSKEGNSYLG